jgi:hypothetical protein
MPGRSSGSIRRGCAHVTGAASRAKAWWLVRCRVKPPGRVHGPGDRRARRFTPEPVVVDVVADLLGERPVLFGAFRRVARAEVESFVPALLATGVENPGVQN